MAEKEKRKFRFPILAKAFVMIVAFAVVIVEISMTYYTIVISKRNTETFINISNSLSATIAKVLDKSDVELLTNKVDSILDGIQDKWITSEEIDWDDEECVAKVEDYLSEYEVLKTDTEFQTTFTKVRNILRDIVEANEAHAIDCAYLAHFHKYEENGEQKGLFVYLCDSALDETEVEEGEESDACPPGWLDPIYPMNYHLFEHPELGFPAYTTDTGYGKLMTAGSAIKLSETTYSYALVDISLDSVRANQASSIMRLFAYLMITVNAIAIAGIILVYFLFSKPIKKLKTAAQSFNKDDPNASQGIFENLNIKSHDEIKDLSDAFKNMEASVREQITELTAANVALVTARSQAHKMALLANKDSLTGVQSKTAYDTKVEEINEKIKNKEKLAFGIAMIDLNYLKNTNDEYGHDAGDESLIKLSNVICLTFQHSPVYRVGGDEFVVILSDGDYENADKLITEFNERIQDSINNKKTPLYKRVSAAIGYSKFDSKKDKCVDDVFKRSDQAMYMRKRDMKEHIEE